MVVIYLRDNYYVVRIQQPTGCPSCSSSSYCTSCPVVPVAVNDGGRRYFENCHSRGDHCFLPKTSATTSTVATAKWVSQSTVSPKEPSDWWSVSRPALLVIHTAKCAVRYPSSRDGTAGTRCLKVATVSRSLPAASSLNDLSSSVSVNYQ